ncbi:hypothetical protein ARC310_01080 [Pantoea ananatis]|uniref:type V toxin-antitoxin system endoribonuclease antitoxin GhoS n=1 Tax=Pantoea ananas TaxID=553 RepID=UPI000DA6986E|nr:type V toxin-antitoxin system endoribonuclease antitoxin GhoS [Pantoea ananatis]PZD66094.1 hypothetical protein ARC311_09545 [Pantoea ananatis]PZD68958.1 hypothetical protein ARC310_01080 [Pantoea ananatis]
MSNGDLHRYVVTFHYRETGLSDVLTLTGAMTSGGFSTTLVDDKGNPHELGTNSFGIVTTLTQEDLKQQVIAAGESALGQTPGVTLTTLDDFLRDAARSTE